MLNLNWQKCGKDKDGHWCSLERLNLEGVTESGVYIIWHEGNPSRVVYVGQGNPISTRLSAHRNNKDILNYGQKGTLRVTWASVAAADRDAVERFLAEALNPLVGSAYPDTEAIRVNLPWKS